MPPKRSPAPSRVGFTLVELLLVVTLIGILTAVAVPRFPLAALRADAGVRSLRGALQLAQRLAVTRQADVVVLLDTAGSRVRLYEDYNRNGSVDGNERIRSFPLDEGARLASPPSGGAFGSASSALVGTNLRVRDGIPTVTFRRNGTASSDVELYLVANSTRGSAWRGIVVAPSTGRVEAWRLVDATWGRMQP